MNRLCGFQYSVSRKVRRYVAKARNVKFNSLSALFGRGQRYFLANVFRGLVKIRDKLSQISARDNKIKGK